MPIIDGDTYAERAEAGELAGRPAEVANAPASPLSGAKITRATGAITVPHQTITIVQFDLVSYDIIGYHDEAFASRLTVPKTGFYIVGGSISFPSNATGARQVGVIMNGGIILVNPCQSAITGQPTTMSCTTTQFMTAGDYVELRAWQNSGGDLFPNVPGDGSPNLWIAHLR